MDYNTISIILLPISIIFILHHFFIKNFTKPKLPPGPTPWPVIGNIHLLGSKPHRSVTDLAKTYGPLMTLKLGSVTTIVISSPDVAKEMYLKHDLAFSSRFVTDGIRTDKHEEHSVVWLPVSPKWRNFRKILAIELFTNQRLEASQVLRKKKVDDLVMFAKSCCEKGIAIDIAKASVTTSLNLLSNTLFSMDFARYDSSVTGEFKDVAAHLLENGAKPNVSDFFPLLRPLDLQGLKKTQTVYFRKMMGFVEEILDERLRDPKGAKEDTLDTLLKLVNENELSLLDVKHLLVDLFIAGTDTTSNVLEWSMSELVRHPEKMTKAQDEINQVLGKDQPRSIQESDISNLPYIQAIVKETLRLHPPTPFLLPHKTVSDVQLCGYHVPKNAQVWVNVWSIGRDPSVWENPESFMPERFLGSAIDYKGRDFELISFGSGRRMCPGMPLAHRMSHLMLATLLRSFNWKLGHGLNFEDFDMEEKFGTTLLKVQPLQVVPLAK